MRDTSIFAIKTRRYARIGRWNGIRFAFRRHLYSRDQAHKGTWLIYWVKGKDLAFDLKKAAIFYCGPSPALEVRSVERWVLLPVIAWISWR